MNLSQLLLALRARYKIIVLMVALTVASAIVVTLFLPKKYLATTALVVNYKGVDPVTGLSLPSQLMPGYISTQVDIIKSKSVALKVVDRLKYASDPVWQQRFKETADGEGSIQDWIADVLLAAVDVAPSRESSVLNISVKGSNPKFVTDVANAFAAAYLEFSVQLKTTPAQEASSYITTRTKLLREEYEAAQKKLADYQQKNNIYSADRQLDVETARLNELSSQLVVIQGQAMDTTSRQRQAQSNPGQAPDVLSNPLIQNLKSTLAAAEGRFSDLSQKLAPNHPSYIAAKAEVDKMRASLAEQISAASTGISSNARINQQREAEVRAALEAQKAKVLSLGGARSEFNLLQNEAENARRAYENVTQRFNQTSFEGQSKQADIAVLTAATEPRAPSGPKMLINAIMAFVVGLILGTGVALLLELLDQRIRSAAQLGELLGLPVLGVIGKPHGLAVSASQPRLAGGGKSSVHLR